MLSHRADPFRRRIALLVLAALILIPASCDEAGSPSSDTSSSLTITEPGPNATVGESSVVIRGSAPPNASVALDKRLALDEKVTADSGGSWEFSLKLEKGKNEFVFHLADDGDVKATITIFYDTSIASSTASTGASSAPVSPTASSVPLSMKEQLEKSYRDNLGFFASATDEGLNIVWAAEAGLVTINLTPKALASEGNALTVAGASAIVASRAIWSTYPAVQELSVLLWTTFIDQNGNSSRQIAASTTVIRTTAAKFNYDGLKQRALSDNKLFFCAADEYRVHPSVYAALKDKGCLATWGFQKS